MSSGGTQDLTLDTVAKGSAPERFKDALKEVVANVADPNTDAKAVRKIVMTITIKPDETRSQASSHLDVKTTLAPPKSVPDTMYFGVNRKTGEVVVTRYDPQQSPETPTSSHSMTANRRRSRPWTEQQ